MLALSAVSRSLASRACRASSAAVPRPALAERHGVLAVEADALAGQQVVVDGLAQERVAEGVVVAVGDEDVRLDGPAQALVERDGDQARGGLEHLVGDLAAAGAGRPDDLPGVVVEAVQAHQQDVGEVGGHPAAGQGGRAGELLDEERVALGAGHDVAELGLAQPGRHQLADQGADGVVGQRRQRHPVDPAQPGPLRDLAAQRVAAVQVVGAVGGDDRDGAVELAGEEEAEHVAGGPVGPVGVLDDQQERAALGGGLEHRVHGAEEVGAVERLGVVAGGGRQDAAARLEAGERGVDGRHLADDVGQVEGEATEHLGEREVGQGAVAEVEAVAGDDLPALGDRQVAQLEQQPRLADAGVAREQDGPAVAPRAVRGRTDAERRGDLPELGVATHQGRARVRHGPHDVACRRHRSGASRLRHLVGPSCRTRSSRRGGARTAAARGRAGCGRRSSGSGRCGSWPRS
nr:hypothetical protein [Nocardioides lijunqiniae]